jgi:hypothetical protein
MMAGAKKPGLQCLIKLRGTNGLAKLIEKLARSRDKAGWPDIGHR